MRAALSNFFGPPRTRKSCETALFFVYCNYVINSCSTEANQLGNVLCFNIKDSSWVIKLDYVFTVIFSQLWLWIRSSHIRIGMVSIQSITMLIMMNSFHLNITICMRIEGANTIDILITHTTNCTPFCALWFTLDHFCFPKSEFVSFIP